MMPFDTYKTYLALKNHFTKDNYDYHKYCGKVRASVDSFYKRKDRFWFERVSRNKTDKEVLNYFVSNFVMAMILAICGLELFSVKVIEIILRGKSAYNRLHTSLKKRRMGCSVNSK